MLIYKMEKKRLFIAIDLPEELSKGIKSLRQDIKGLKWVKPEQIHLTLNFLGDTPLSLLEQLKSELKEIKFTPFSLNTAKCGFFPNERRPSVFWLGLDESPELMQLKAQIDAKLEEIGIVCEKRKFVPHITLARIKKRLGKDLVDQLKKSGEKLKGNNFQVEQFILFASELRKEGAMHTKELIIQGQ